MREQALEEARVKLVRVHHNCEARAQPSALDAAAVVQHRLLPGHEPGVGDLALEIERHRPSNHTLLAASRDDFPGLINQLGAHHNARRDVRRKGVADARTLDGEGERDRIAGPIAGRARASVDREPRAHHVGIVNAAPQVAAVGHVAVLALNALAREAAGLPLVVGVLE